MVVGRGEFQNDRTAYISVKLENMEGIRHSLGTLCIEESYRAAPARQPSCAGGRQCVGQLQRSIRPTTHSAATGMASSNYRWDFDQEIDLFDSEAGFLIPKWRVRVEIS